MSVFSSLLSSSSTSTSGITTTTSTSTTSAASEMLSSTSRQSIFVNGYIPTSKATDYEDDYRTKTYLQLSSSTLTSLSSTLTTSTINSLSDDDFWELIVTDYSEAHSEKHAIVNSLSESFCWFATGANPIQISLTAKVLTGGDKDYRTEFLYQYTANLRARQLSQNSRTLAMVMKDTLVRLYVLSLNFNESSQEPDFSTFTMTALGYKYKNTNSEMSSLYQGYYGTTSVVSTRASSSSSTDSSSAASTSTDSSSSSTSATTSTGSSTNTTTSTAASTTDEVAAPSVVTKS